MSSAQLERATASEPDSSKTCSKLQEHRRIFLPHLVSCQMLIIGNPADVSGVVRHPTAIQNLSADACPVWRPPSGSCHPRALYQRCWFRKHLPTPVVAGTTEAV